MRAVLGGPGAGKTALLRAVAGTLRYHRGAIVAGEIMLAGRRIDRRGPGRTVGAGVVTEVVA